MKPWVVVLGICGALLVGLGVWKSVAADIRDLVDAAGWWAFVALAWPMFLAVLALIEWRRRRI